MFAQLLITLALVLTLTEVLSRLVLGRSAISILRRPAGSAAVRAAEPETADAVTRVAEQRLDVRLRDLQEARRRVVVASETTDVTEELEERERELRDIEARLAEIEDKRIHESDG